METMIIAFVVLCASAFFSMIGLGGAIFYVPFFYWLTGDFIFSVTTALLLNFTTSGSAAITYIRNHMVDFKTAIPFVFASIIGAQIGAFFTKIAPVDFLLFMLSLLMLFVGEEMIFSKVQILYKRKQIKGKIKYLIIVICGLLIGMISGMIGIGGGSLIVPLLLVIGFDMKRAAASSGFMVFITSISAFIAHISSWKPDYYLIAAIIIAAFSGAQLGSHLMHSRVRAETLQKTFGVVLWMMAAKILSGLL